MLSIQELSDLMGNVSTLGNVKYATVANKGNQVVGIVELEGDSKVPPIEDVTMDLVQAVNILEQREIYANWQITTKKKVTRVFNKGDDRTFYYLTDEKPIVLIQPTLEKIGDYSATSVLRAYIDNISK